MPLVYSCLAPHGTDVIADLAKDSETVRAFSKTRKAMLELAKQMERAQPDIVVIASPHNLRLWKKIGISIAENSSGSLSSERGRPRVRTLSLSVRCDTRFARLLYARSIKTRLPAVGANYGTFEGPNSCLPMDWGTFVPLWFLLPTKGVVRREYQITKPRIVIVTPSREIPIRQNILFGRLVARLAEEEKDSRVAFVASADQAHCHRRDGPYGYHPSAREFDGIAVGAVKKVELGELFELDPSLIENARPDSIWQLAMLYGAALEVPMVGHFLSYEVPTYFGMICAGFTPARKRVAKLG